VDESVVLGHATPYVVYKADSDKTEEPRRASGISR
jgi:hypothetical protein